MAWCQDLLQFVANAWEHPPPRNIVSQLPTPSSRELPGGGAQPVLGAAPGNAADDGGKRRGAQGKKKNKKLGRKSRAEKKQTSAGALEQGRAVMVDYLLTVLPLLPAVIKAIQGQL